MSESLLAAEAIEQDAALDHSTIIRLEKIAKVYGKGETAVHALSEVNLTVAKGEYCAIMGASGSGKSTMMNIIGCLDRPTSGCYYLDNLNVAVMSDTELAKIRNRKIGFVFQQFHLLPQMTALENVMLPMVYAGVPAEERHERAAAALQQRVAIARAIVNRPLLLLADEPTGALDSQTTREVLQIFAELNASNITVVMVTHEADVARHSRRIIWFRDGQVIYDYLDPERLRDVL